MIGRLSHRALYVGACFWMIVVAWGAVPKAAPAQADPAKAEAAAAKPEAAAAKPEAAPAKAETPASHTVKKGLLKIVLDLDGVFESQTASEIVVRPEEWSASGPLTVRSVVKHGARVKKGEVLVTFDTEKIDKAIDDLRTELKLTELGLQQADQQLRAMERTTPMDLEANERAARMTEEDRKYFFEVERPFELKSNEFNLKSAKNMLEYQEEELRQLEKMYKADDITEETEEIVLKRTRDQVEFAKMMVESYQLRHDHTLKFTIPRQDDRIKDSSQRSLLESEKTKLTLPIALQKQRLDLDKLRVQQARSGQRLKELLADRELLTVKSPLEGLAYYGKSTRGKFADAQTVAEMLRPHGNVQPNQVFMTVVQPQSVVIRTTVPEEQLHRLRPGLSGVAIPSGYPDLRLPAVITRVSDVPLGPGGFDAQLKVTLDKDAQPVVPGLVCKVKLVPYLKKDALIVPPKAVLTEELDDQPYVTLLAKDGKTTKRPVTVGNKTDKAVEILKGLAEGDQVLLEAPKDAK